ncbi:MAG: GNAT family N-acetyltransferase [Acidimicrobiia bacterium]
MVPVFETPKEIHTERLLLRPFRPGDVDAVARYADDDDYRRYLSPYQLDAEEFVAHNVGVNWSVQRSWVITLENEIVGSTFLGINSEDDAAELTCLIAPRWWAKGFGTEVARAAVEHAFVELRLTKVVGRTDPRHEASVRLMTKLGMQCRGSTRADDVIYEINRDDWSRARPAAR